MKSERFGEKEAARKDSRKGNLLGQLDKT